MFMFLFQIFVIVSCAGFAAWLLCDIIRDIYNNRR